jgi:perosamine synthetase
MTLISLSTEPITMSAPDISDRERQLVQEVLSSGILSGGRFLEEFERRIGGLCGGRPAVGVSSGTAGLHTAVIAAGLRPGDEVVTTSFSFVSSANCVLYERASPVFADIDPVTLNMDPASVEAAITPRTRGIIAVHVFGQPVDMDPVLEIARRRGLFVIEDACEALGAEYKGRPAGTLADAGVFAFYANKQITTGEGGVVVSGRDDVAAAIRALRNQGRAPGDTWLQHSRLGFNYRLSELHAAIGVGQLERLDALLANRARVARGYTERLAGDDRIELPYIASTTTRMSWFVYVVRLQHGIDRDWVIRELQDRGIPGRAYFPPIHLQPYMREQLGCGPGLLPVTERESARTLALPFHGALTDPQLDYVCAHLRDVIGQFRTR